MDNHYNELAWYINFNIGIEFEHISASIIYKFENRSKTKNFFYNLLPRFQKLPKKSFKTPHIAIEANLYNGYGPRKAFEKSLFSYVIEPEGIPAVSDCLVPIPWGRANDYIPPQKTLELTFHWIEGGLRRTELSGGLEEWHIHHPLPMKTFFLPIELQGMTSDYNSVNPPESIIWKVYFPVIPEEITYNFDSFEIDPSTSYPPDQTSIWQFSIVPNDHRDIGIFQDQTLILDARAKVPLEIAEKFRQAAAERVRSYTFKACVSVVDLRGSTPKAEEKKGEPNPTADTSKFQQIAREIFPQSFLNSEPTGLILKKVDGDRVLLVSPLNKAEELFSNTMTLLDKLSSENFLCRTGFHIDDAVDQGTRIYSPDSYGTECLGLALSYAAKVGDDKSNEGIRLTAPAVLKLQALLGQKFDFKPVGTIEKVPYELFELIPKKVVPVPAASKSFHFADRLCEKILAKNSRACVGLDPDLSRFPRELLQKYEITKWPPDNLDEALFEKASRCIIEFNQMVINAVSAYVAAVKPQSAHYERFGYQGIRALAETVRYARSKDLLVILDSKRNDIGSTAEKYALAYLGSETGPEGAAIPFDAITVNPYLGKDGITPFVDLCAKYGKGIFILVKTSNTSSGDLQDLPLHECRVTLSQRVASLVNFWGGNVKGERGYSAIGAVVGATFPDDTRILRGLMPNCFFLMPGFGAQGGKAEDLKCAFSGDGLGALISSSRDIIYPCPPETAIADFMEGVRKKSEDMQKALNGVISPGK